MSHGQKHQWAYEFCKWEIKLFVCFARLRAVMYIVLNVHCEASGEAKGKSRSREGFPNLFDPRTLFFPIPGKLFSLRSTVYPQRKVSNTWLSWVNGAESLYFPHPSQTFPDPASSPPFSHFSLFSVWFHGLPEILFSFYYSKTVLALSKWVKQRGPFLMNNKRKQQLIMQISSPSWTFSLHIQ